MASVEEALGRARAIASLSLHRSTYVPNEQEAYRIKSLARSLRELRDQLDLELQHLQQPERATAILSSDRQALDAQIDLHDALLAPHRRLPFDLLSQIFILLLPDSWDDEPAATRRLDIMHVCMQWRTIALATTCIWSSLRFCVRNSPMANRATAVSREMSKTGHASLRIAVDALQGETRLYRGRMVDQTFWGDDAWNILCSACQRWRQVTLRGIPRSAYDTLTHYDFPMLSSLSLALFADENSPVEVPLHVFKNAPVIKALSIQYYSPPLGLVIPSAWQITELTLICGENGPGRLYTQSVAPALDAIQACSGTLRKCAVTADEAGPLNTSHTQLALPALEELCLVGSAIHICRLVSAQNITAVTLRPFRLRHIDIIEPLQALLQRSRGCPTLRKFTILDSLVSSSRLLSFLRSVPQITDLHLSLVNSYSTPAFVYASTMHLATLRALSRNSGIDDATTLLPNLSRLHLDIQGVGDNTPDRNHEYWEAVREIILSREHPRVVEGVSLACLQLEDFTDSNMWHFVNTYEV